MKSWRTKSAYEIFQVLSGRSNAYYIATEKCNILVDTGKRSAYLTLTKNIELLKRSSKHIDFLILTHTHFDHCQNAARISQQYSSKIIISENEASYVEDGYTPVPYGTTPVSKLIYRMGIKLAEKRFSKCIG